MIHFGHPKLTANNQKPYSNDKWHMLKEKHNLDKTLFSILDLKFNDKFYSKNLKLNPSDEAPPLGFKRFLEKWIQNGNVKDVAAKAILLDSHYKYDRVNNMSRLLDVMDKESSTSFLQNDVTWTINVIYTTHSLKDVPIIWKGPNWESFLIRIFNAKANFIVVACICDQESFKSLLTIVSKSIFVTKI